MVRFMSTDQEQCIITGDANQEKQNKKIKEKSETGIKDQPQPKKILTKIQGRSTNESTAQISRNLKEPQNNMEMLFVKVLHSYT